MSTAITSITNGVHNEDCQDLSTLSLAFAMIGGYLVFAPSQAEAGDHISYEALKRNHISTSLKNQNNGRAGKQANKYSRGCSAITRCRG